MISLRIIILILFSFFIFGGCGKNARDNGKDKKTDSTLTQTNIVQRVDSINKFGLNTLIQKRNGKILLLNILATWCLPCIEEFPDLVKLSESYEPGKLEIVGISVDYPDEVKSKILPFLTKHSVPFKIYVANFNKDEDLINTLDLKWNGAIPASFIYDNKGKQQFKLIGKSTFDHFKTKVDSLITKQ
ncbi:MAG: TlpA disulfide reductase family protein [Ignavibacteriales bacterium]|nr:TlpA disulfide reductase family protein [Ignavibacteriales bacterium]